MARQSASQHLAALQAANLVNTVWQGRQELHHLDPVPLHDPGRTGSATTRRHGSPFTVANLESLLETGSVLPQAPWESSAS